ncbi:MAG: hypothetical protein ACREL7_11400 [Longimicrobiales bacterium]
MSERVLSESAATGGIRRFVGRIPLWVWVLAVGMALLHMTPYWRAAVETPETWRFTGNLSISPDYMQYRVWSRQTAEEGPIVSNRFTAEPNRAHLPVMPYWIVGQTARILGITPEWAYAYIGAVLVAGFLVLLYALTRWFLKRPRATAWVFAVQLLGGGLGGYMMWLRDWSFVRSNYALNALFVAPFQGEGRSALFESYRGNYILQSIFDTHFMLFWLVTTVAVIALWAALRRFSIPRLVLTCLLFAFGTFLHVYEGLTLLVIATGVCMAVWRKGVPGRTALAVLSACIMSVAVVLLPLTLIYKSSGLPAPEWRGLVVEFPILVLAYPVAWLLLVPGILRYWRDAGVDGAFLVGWGLALLLLTLSGPFFPYPDRGTMTLQIPLMLAAGGIWFARHDRLGWKAILLLLILAGSTTLFTFESWFSRTAFTEDQPHKYVSPAHDAVIEALRDNAIRRDILVANQLPLRWIAPEYPGVHYAGHFFLTPGFRAKQDTLAAFWAAQPDAQHRFLESRGVRWLFVEPDQDPARFERIPGLVPAVREPVGTLFEFRAASG